MDKILDAKITAFLEKNKQAMFRDIDRMLRIDSVTGEPAPGAPYGQAINEALDTILDICASHGLKTRNVAGSVGEAVYGGGEESLGIVTHVDIVPAGTGWTKPPHQLTEEGGMLYGRGVVDNKGPGVASLWALLAALDAGFVPKKRIVLLFGGDEERGMGCMKRYLQTEKAPDIAFTPDAGFPLIYCEKTICNGALQASLPGSGALKDIRGGTRPNVVPNQAEALLAVKPAGALPRGISVEQTDAGWRVAAEGCAAHASTPEKGDNAIVKLLGALPGLLPAGDPAAVLTRNLHRLCAASDGSGFGIACRDEESGPLTFNLGVIGVEGGEIAARFDIRHPTDIDPEENILRRLPEAAAAAGFTALGIQISRGFRIPKEHQLVSTLMRIYNDVTHGNESPLAIGGGTYARTLPCAVAYGMLFEGDPESAHMADERISVESFMKATRIFAHAIAALG